MELQENAIQTQTPSTEHQERITKENKRYSGLAPFYKSANEIVEM